ncbi:MAG: hypothetical protein GQ540_03415 [Lutibacter sp.]|uniref:hypothetical protein n=1 Tax=Lutibacter sp. TaxID=1925666 RepID=UPI0019ED8497|nr:hypothetical protein [Lutibacter sp.]NOR27561.1 hypothetical protein [Lutibacter sp.]
MKNKKVSKSEEVRNNLERLDKQEKRCDEVLIHRRENMTSKLCPLNQKHIPIGKCFEDCIHFSKGHVFEFDNNYYIRNPACKLWR